MTTRILFLAAHLQPFLASGIHSLLANYDVEIVLYCKNRPENELIKIAPGKGLRIFTYDYEPETFFWKEIDLFQPNIVFCAGWMFPMYVSWSKVLRKTGAKTICVMDTQWKGTFKQKLLVLAAPFTLRKSFTNAWVPGVRQKNYALRLGFVEAEILEFLCAPDTALFSQSYKALVQGHPVSFPKRFLYAGRLETHKLKNLLLAFHSISPAELGLWRLQIVGNGQMGNDVLLKHPSIDVRQSLPQMELQKVVEQCGILCLCSTDEPWGTVAQEFAAAGFPLLLSQQCGASDHFLSGNGFLCDGNNIEDIKSGLMSFIQSSDKALFQMSEISHQLGIQSNSDTWSKTLMSLV